MVANETVGGEALREQIAKQTEGYRAEVLVVTPALNSPIRHFTSDVDGAREQARQRLEQSLGRLRDAGIEARGEVGDGDPLQAIEDALRTFGADEVIDLDASRRPLALARARRRHERARALRGPDHARRGRPRSRARRVAELLLAGDDATYFATALI